MTEEDERQLKERHAILCSMVQSLKLSLDGAARTGELRSTQEFAVNLYEAATEFLDLVDAIMDGNRP